MILAEHWQMLVDVANGRSELPLEGSTDADVALELAKWGLIIGDEDMHVPAVTVPEDLSQLPAPPAPPEPADPDNERYRELRDQRRSLRS